MKGLNFLLGALFFSWSLSVHADDTGNPVPVTPEPLTEPAAVYLSFTTQSAVFIHSSRLPKWSFGVLYDRELPYHPMWIDSIDTYRPVDSLTLKASRAIASAGKQRLFAAIQTSNNQNFESQNQVYLPSNAGVAASLGWQVGKENSLNMAVEYEYREIGQQELQSIVLGVQYYF